MLWFWLALLYRLLTEELRSRACITVTLQKAHQQIFFICIFSPIPNEYILVWPVLLAHMLPHPQLIFPSKTWFFGIYLNFQRQKSFKNHYLPHSEYKSYQINSIKSCSSRSSNNTKGIFQFLWNFQLRFNLIFSSIFKNFCTTSPNVMEQGPCTPPGRELSKDTKNTIWNIPVQWIS
jgi:hypothetical protein